MLCVYRIGDTWFKPQKWNIWLVNNCGTGIITCVLRNTYCTEHLELLTKRSLHSTPPRNHYATHYHSHNAFLPHNHHSRHFKTRTNSVQKLILPPSSPPATKQGHATPRDAEGLTRTHARPPSAERLSSVTKTNRGMSHQAPRPTRDSRSAQSWYGLLSKAFLNNTCLLVPLYFLWANLCEIRIIVQLWEYRSILYIQYISAVLAWPWREVIFQR